MCDLCGCDGCSDLETDRPMDAVPENWEEIAPQPEEGLEEAHKAKVARLRAEEDCPGRLI